MRSLPLAAVILLLAVPGWPQQAPKPAPAEDPGPLLKVDVDLVNLLFSVRNRQGGLVGSLEKHDFTLLEDGKEQEIKYFTRETDLPLTIGLLVDVSRSQERLLDIERSAASQFFSSVLRKKDMAFLISFGSEAELLQDFTGSPKLLRSALGQLRISSDIGGIMPGPVPTASHPRGTVLYDAIFLAADEKLKGEVGRKAIVVITDGMDQGSRLKLQQAVEAAQKADSIIYGIYYVDQAAYGYFGGATDSYLKRMAEETGGRVFHVDRKNTLDSVFKQLQDELRSQYAVAYTPSNPSKDGTFRKIEIRTANKDQKVQARKGYYALKRS